MAGYIASKGIPFPEVCATIAIAAELRLGLLLLVGWQARWAALGLAIFLAVITPIFHGYWAVPEAQQRRQKQSFNKNIGVLGGLLVITAFGAGRWSLDGRRAGANSHVTANVTSRDTQRMPVWVDALPCGFTVHVPFNGCTMETR